jgi:Putative MetA-pathway of phenol degradation
MRSLLLALVIAPLSVLPARAEELRDFCADRPGKATPPCILDVGHLQIETGLADAVFTRNAGVHDTTYTFAASELRLGLTPWLEAEADWAPLIVDHDGALGDRSGVGDLTLGLRGALIAPKGDGLAVSLQGFVSAPTATHGLGAGGWWGGVRLPAQVPLGPLALGLTPEVDVVRNASGGGTHAAWIGVASLSHGFGKLTLGAEAWGQVDDDPAHVSHQASADLTAALAVGANGQLDAGVNIGLTRETPDLEVYVGVAHRF